MTDLNVPNSPEEYPADVREELHQHDVTHEGTERVAEPEEEMSAHLGAVDTETSLVTPPMRGPTLLTEGEDENMGIDPADEIPGG
ncbi:MAG TPA: hypothetical protein VF707_06725 [Ardenticatenaceae bacterium]|jgi:hypothetical protein